MHDNYIDEELTPIICIYHGIAFFCAKNQSATRYATFEKPIKGI
jgi:hypothetical protein